MIRWSALMVFAARRALVAVALLATLSSGFGFQLHVAHADHTHGELVDVAGHRSGDHDCGSHLATTFTGELTCVGGGDDGGGLGSERDPDGCGHCHCQVPATTLPTITLTADGAGNITILEMPIVLPIRDGITYQPDPLPVRS